MERDENAFSREETLETFMRDRGRDRARRLVEDALASNSASETPGGLALLRELVAPLAGAVRGMLDEEKARLGRPSFIAVRLSDMPAELVAYLTLREAINFSHGGAPLFRLARHVAGALEDEVRMAAFDEAAPALYRTVERDVKRKSWDAEHAELVYAAAARAAEIELPRWPTTEKVHIGIRLIDLLIEATGLVDVSDRPMRRNKTVKYVQATEAGQSWMSTYNEKAGLLRPALAPTVVPPLPWKGTIGGGYLTHAVRPFAVVKRTFRAHVDALKVATSTGQMAPVYRAVNAIQETPWRINRRVLGVIQEADERGIPLPGLPLPDPEPLPPKPDDIGSNDMAKRAWKEAAKAVYERRAENVGRRLELSQLLTVCREYRDEERIFFPHQLDFRGRVYAVPNALHPQGSDRAKALLHFAEGKPVGKAGLHWLAIQGANTFGFDKASFEEREAWAWQHAEMASLCASDPFQWSWWTEADSPWCFLAWCFEWSAMMGMASDQGEGFISHLPIALDGSCNGLQHFSAMLRDPVGGAAVNLVPADKPQDIYQRVADRATERLRDLLPDNEKGWFARGWIDFGLNRKITKRPVMVLPYGGTMSSCMEYTRAAVREQIKEGKENPFGDELPKAEAFLAGVIWSAIGDVVVAAREVMGWLQQVARIAARHGQPIQWVTPSGFVAHQEYRDLRHRRVKSRLRGSLIYLSHFEQTDQLDPSRQALAISPNFVHSMDAAAMMLTINRCLDDGIRSFAMIHDSYGTHAADTERLAGHLRRAFVSMYEEHDVLAEFLASVRASLPPDAAQALSPPPNRGVLDLHQVHQSAYFFA